MSTTVNPLERLSHDSTTTDGSTDTTASTDLLQQLTATVISSLESKLTEHASTTENNVISQVNRLLTEKTDGLTERAAKRFQEDSAADITNAQNKDQYIHNLSIIRTMDKVAYFGRT